MRLAQAAAAVILLPFGGRPWWARCLMNSNPDKLAPLVVELAADAHDFELLSEEPNNDTCQFR
jgi:hypothetical protein